LASTNSMHNNYFLEWNQI